MKTDYTRRVRDTIVAHLMIAADALDVASTMLAEHFDDDDDVFAKIDLEITCAGACALGAIFTLGAQQPPLQTAWSA